MATSRSTSTVRRRSTSTTSMTTCSVVRHCYTIHKRSVCHRFNTLLIPGQQTPQTIYSPGPRLVLLFKAGSKPGSGFKAQYRFETGKKAFCIQAFTQQGRLDKKLNWFIFRISDSRHPSARVVPLHLPQHEQAGGKIQLSATSSELP